MTVRVRFAPSPTGDLHIGGARTALYNQLLAQHHGGTHVLRIEDTDRKRNTGSARQGILDGLAWLGITWDEGPLYQSERLDTYREWAVRLEATGQAYWRDDPDKGRALVFRHGGGRVEWDDAVHGRTGRDMSDDPDLVCLKSDGWPAYNFACVVDDITMQISHVLRGDDHLSNTPKQLALYRALGADPPVFAHLPLILNPDGSKMSKDWKKQGKGGRTIELPTAVLRYRDLGYLGPALRNFLALMGWSPGDDREVLAPDVMAAAFTLDRVKHAPARFDLQKLEWMNGVYLREMSVDHLISAARPFVAAAGLDPDRVTPALAGALQEKLKTLAEFPERARFALDDAVTWNAKAVRKHLKPGAEAVLTAMRDVLADVEPFTVPAVEAALAPVLEAHGGIRAVGQVVRVAATGTTVSPELFATVALVGRARMLERCLAAVAQIQEVR